MARTQSASAHRKVLQAALELVAERGVDATSMDAVAQKSGVSKATIYKHWADKDGLSLEMLAEAAGLHARPEFDSGQTRDDMLAVLSYRPPEHPRMRDRILPHFVAYSARNKIFGTAWRKTVNGAASSRPDASDRAGDAKRGAVTRVGHGAGARVAARPHALLAHFPQRIAVGTSPPPRCRRRRCLLEGLRSEGELNARKRPKRRQRTLATRPVTLIARAAPLLYKYGLLCGSSTWRSGGRTPIKAVAWPRKDGISTPPIHLMSKKVFVCSYQQTAFSLVLKSHRVHQPLHGPQASAEALTLRIEVLSVHEATAGITVHHSFADVLNPGSVVFNFDFQGDPWFAAVLRFIAGTDGEPSPPACDTAFVMSSWTEMAISHCC